MIDMHQCKMARAALGWSAAELARRAGVGVATVNRFEASQGEPTAATIAAMQRALESAGAIFEKNDYGLSGVKIRRLRAGDLVQLRPQSKLRYRLKDQMGKVVQVEQHPPETGPTYRVWAEFLDGERVEGVFSFEFELVKAAPEWSSIALADFMVVREETEFDGVIVHCFDNQKLVLALVARPALEDYFRLPHVGERRPTIAECSSLVDINLPAFKRVIGGKYARGEYKMLNRYGSTHPFIELTLADIQATGETLREPNAQHSWHSD
jgi:transcriptional regulator with XRE-family HTH domain